MNPLTQGEEPYMITQADNRKWRSSLGRPHWNRYKSGARASRSFALPFPWYNATIAQMHSSETTRSGEGLKQFIRDIPDFPKPGILFRDITPLLANPTAFRNAIELMAEHYQGRRIDAVASAEARGFIFAAPLAIELGIGFVPIRKRGKLPFNVRSQEYELEYGTDTVEMHQDALSAGHSVLLIDDLLATGGTTKACCELVEQSGAVVAGCAFLVELGFLGGHEKLRAYEVFSLISYDE